MRAQALSVVLMYISCLTLRIRRQVGTVIERRDRPRRLDSKALGLNGV